MNKIDQRLTRQIWIALILLEYICLMMNTGCDDSIRSSQTAVLNLSTRSIVFPVPTGGEITSDVQLDINNY